MEETLWPSPDLYEAAVWLAAQRQAHCSNCVGSVVGEHPRDWTEKHADSAKWLGSERRGMLYKPYVGCSLASSAGMSLPAQSWERVVAHAAAFCDKALVGYEEALHSMMNAGGSHHRLLEPAWLMHAYPRCLHVGRCEAAAPSPPSDETEAATDAEGAAAAAATCDPGADFRRFARLWVAPMLPGGKLNPSPPHTLNALRATLPNHPERTWRVGEGVALCREKFTPNPVTGALAGVGALNKTMPAKFEELCMAIVKGER